MRINLSPLKIYYVYTLTCPRDNIVRYVGCTVNPRQRLISHLNTFSGGSKKKREWVSELKELGLIPLMDVVKITEKLEEAVIFEKELHNIHNSEYMTGIQLKYMDTSVNRGNSKRIQKRKLQYGNKTP